MAVTMQQSHSRKLVQWLENDRQIVTFRQVSREFGCHVNTAKNILLTHARSNPTLHLTYLLSGPLLSTSSLALTQLPSDLPKLDAKSLAQLAASQRIKIVDMDQISDGERNSEEGSAGGDPDDMLTNDKGDEDGIAGHTDLPIRIEEEEIITPESTPRWGVVMAAQEHLEEKRALFEPDGLNIHIYALSPGPITDPAQYLIPNTLLREYPNYNDPKYGGITGDLAQGIGSSGGKALKEGVMDFGSKPATSVWRSGKPEEAVKGGKKEELGAGKKGVEGKKAMEVKKEVKEEMKGSVKGEKGRQDGMAKAETGKKDVQVKSEPQAEPSSSSSTTRKPSSSAPKSRKRIITSDDEDEDDPSPHPATDTADPTSSPSRQQTSSMVRADDRAAMEAMMGMDFDMDDDNEEEVEPMEDKKDKKKKADGVKKGKKVEVDADEKKGKAVVGERKKRKVKKSRTEMDDKGYMVTKDYTSEESYSGESDSNAAPNPKSNSTSKTSRPTANKPRKSTQSRASSVSTDIADPAPTTLATTGQGQGGSTSSVGSAKPPGGAGGRAVPPPRNVPGKPGKPRGQSTLAGFFTKK